MSAAMAEIARGGVFVIGSFSSNNKLLAVAIIIAPFYKHCGYFPNYLPQLLVHYGRLMLIYARALQNRRPHGTSKPLFWDLRYGRVAIQG